MEVYCKKVCSWCDDGFPVIELDGVYYHKDVPRTAPEADPRELCNATPIRAAAAAAEAQEREACAMIAEQQAMQQSCFSTGRHTALDIAKAIRGRASGGNSGGEEGNDAKS